MGILDEVPQIVTDAAGDLFQPATLIRGNEGAFDPSTLEVSDSADTTFECQALVSSYKAFLVATEVVPQGARKIIVLATSLSTKPTTDDRIQVDGETYQIITTERDPAKATWTLMGQPL